MNQIIPSLSLHINCRILVYTMNILEVLILSVVEGLTEFLPISSTGHLILTSKLLGIAQTEFLKTFEISIQLGAICSVVFLYWKRVLENKQIIGKILVAFIPTAIVGLLFYPLIKNVFFVSTQIVVSALFIGGIILILFEKFVPQNAERHTLKEIPYKNSILIGLIQSISIIPGVSRAAATIIGGMTAGLDRKSAVEFSFLLAVPTMFAATALDLVSTAGNFTPNQYGNLVVGFILSFFVALATIKFFINYVEKNNFLIFGVYRIILGFLYWTFVG